VPFTPGRSSVSHFAAATAIARVLPLAAATARHLARCSGCISSMSLRHGKQSSVRFGTASRLLGAPPRCFALVRSSFSGLAPISRVHYSTAHQAPRSSKEPGLSRFGPDPHAFFESVYQGAAPWEIGGAQPAMAALVESFPPGDPVLDIGCATGDLAIHLARLGHEVVGVDIVQRAIEQANAKRSALPGDVARLLSFHVGDAGRPSIFGQFGSIFDSGFLHLLDDEETDSFVDEVSLALVAGGRLYLHEFAREFAIENMPRAVTEGELRERFTERAGWRVLHIGQTEFLNTVAAPTPAISACVERL